MMIRKKGKEEKETQEQLPFLTLVDFYGSSGRSKIVLFLTIILFSAFSVFSVSTLRGVNNTTT